MPFAPGENIGPYRIVEQLGQGGMATVYKAYHAALDRYVAIKALHPAFKQDPAFLARFEREAHIVARLDHPNIIPIYDFAEYEGVTYLVMRFVEGDTAKPLLRQGPLSLERALEIIRPIADALQYAHRQGILHRDIKPSNIILAKDGHIYLTDFGLARMVDPGQSTLSQDMLIGTPQYISPEQAKGVAVDARSDLYSLGVVLFEMLTGRVPFSADTPYAVIHDHIFTPLPLPTKINPNISPAVERVLLKALAKEPDARYTTPNELVAALEEAAVESPSKAAQRPALPTRPRRLSPLALSLVGGSVFGLLIGVVALMMLLSSRLPILALNRAIPTPTVASTPTVAAYTSTPLPSMTAAPVRLASPTSAALTATASVLPPASPTASSPTPTLSVKTALIPSGVFWLGKADSDSAAAADESPGHYVDVSAFSIDTYEVSNAQYSRCVDARGCPKPAGVYSPQTPQMAFGNPLYDNYPVVYVSQDNAIKYCLWAGKRLPTEAEWEKAARGVADRRIYPWGDMWDGYRANAAQGKPGPLPVDAYSPDGCSPLGVCNMSGNVAEWVADFYGAKFYADSQRDIPSLTVISNPFNGESASGKIVVRGGSFRSTIYNARISKREPQSPTLTVDNIGFRCVQSSK